MYGPSDTVTEREPPSRTFISIVLGLAAILHLGIAAAAWYIEDTPLYQGSAVIFFLAAGGCAHVAWRLENIRVVALAGALTMTAYASRAATILYGWAFNLLDVSDARAWIILFSWMLTTVYAYAIFVRGLAPLSRMYRVRNLARKDA